jgi:hypothetical protein
MSEKLVRGNSDLEDAVVGITTTSSKNGVGALNISKNAAIFPGGNAVFGQTDCPGGAGVFGANTSNQGVGVQGNAAEAGVSGFSAGGVGVRGFTQATNQNAIFGENTGSGSVPDGVGRPAGAGVWGHTKVEKGSGLVGSVEPGLTLAAGVTGIGQIAGQFFGDVLVTGDVKLIGGDCAEDFDLAESEVAEPGTVMVMNQEGSLRQGWRSYDKCVAGVVCGAGNFRPGIILDRHERVYENAKRRIPVALLGKVNCKVDAQYGSIEVGDLLTTSATLGHAMKASDSASAFGTVIGKALQRLERGQGLIPILVALQ